MNPKLLWNRIKNPDHYLQGWWILGVGEHPVDQQKEFLEQNGLDQIQLDFNTLYGWSPRDLKFLNDFPDISALKVGGNFSDSENLRGLHNLRSFIDNSEGRKGHDFSNLLNVEHLNVDYVFAHPKYEKFTKLKDLSVGHLPKRFQDISDFEATGLVNLSIGSSPLKSFSGIAKFPELTRLTINSCRHFSLDGLSDHHASLRSLRLHFCKNLNGLENIYCFPNLEEIEIHSCGFIPDLSPLHGLKNLVSIDLFGTNFDQGFPENPKVLWPNISHWNFG